MKLESRKGMAAGALMARQFWFRGLTFRRVPNGGQVALAGLASKPAENRKRSRVSTISGAGARDRVRRASTKGSHPRFKTAVSNTPGTFIDSVLN